MRVVDHARQLDGLPKDIRETNENAKALAGFKVLGYVMIALEICTLGFGLYHLIEGDFFKSAVALAIEISLVVLHLTGMSFERSLHHNNSDRVRRMSDECRDKAGDLLRAAEAYDLRVGRWYRSMRGLDDDADT